MARDKIYLEEEFPTPLMQLWYNFKQPPAVMIGFSCFLFLIVLAVLANIITPYSSVENHLDRLLLPPAWSDEGDVSFLLGTDNLGRDMLSRLMHGTTLTFGLSIIVVIASLAIGVVIGSLSALTTGIKSSFLNHFLDVILSIPSLLLAIIIVAILGPGLENTLWAIVMVLIPQFVHITRNAVKEEFAKDYVLASRLDGAGSIRILRYSIFPNIIEKLISQATLAQSAAILDIAALGFLGLGAPIPMPEWGAMLANGIELFYIAPWTVYLPGLAILFSVIATNLVGEGMRHALKSAQGKLMNLIDIRNLSIELQTTTKPILAVDRVNLTMKEGEVRGLVGESGSGKSLLAQAIVGVLDDKWKVDADRFHWRGNDLMRLSAEERKAIITKDVAMIFQEPMACLDPTTTIGEQLEEAVDVEQLSGFFWQKRQQRKLAAITLLHKVGIKQHETCVKSYPHQLTDALCQRVMIAMALARRPMLLIADEPTAAMESTNQGQIFRLLASLNQLKNMSILLISHDLENVTHWTNTITVMYSGQFVEAGTTEQIFNQPYHPYTRALVDSESKASRMIPSKSRLMTLPGSIPILQHLPIGCRLGPRCPRAQQKCVHAPKVKSFHSHQVSCHFPLKDSY